MKISAIICEFNPIHTGHKRLLDYAHSISDVVVCIMSGNFVQRGMPACAEKYSRARHAVLCGANIVIELPTIFATASAENFALGGVKIANQIGADYLVFGSECGDICQLQLCADKLLSPQVNEKIKGYLAQGMSYPKAVGLAIESDILQSPNNTLAVEYLKALSVTNSKIKPKTIMREANYNDTQTGTFASSTALRKDKKLREKFTFDFVIEDIDEQVENKYQQFATHYLSLLDKSDFDGIEGISEGLENKFLSADKSHGYDEMIEQVKSKRYTRAKLQRIALNCVLKITVNQVGCAKQKVVDTKVLAIKSQATALLERVNNQVDQITKRADKLYYSLSGVVPLTKLQKIDN